MALQDANRRAKRAGRSDVRDAADGAAPPRRRPRRPAPGGAGWYPWTVLGVVVSGNFLAALNVTVMGVTLPEIGRELGTVGPLDADWVVTIYLLGVIAVQPATAWLAERWGQKTVYLAALSVFGLGSLSAALAPTLPLLLAARFVMGVGGGVLMPLGMGMLLEVFPPHRRGLVLGIRGVAIMAAPAMGPPIGGLLATQASWRFIFAVFVPITIAALILAARLLRSPARVTPRRLDAEGWALAFAGIGLLVLGARQAGVWGFDAPATIAVLAAGIGLLVVLVRRSLRRDEPMIQFRLFTAPTFTISLCMLWMVTVLHFARMSFLPIELQVVHELTAQQVGLILSPAALGVAATMPIGGWLADRVGARTPVLCGLAVLTYTGWQLAHFSPQTSVRWIVAVLVIQGLGTGLVVVPLNVVTMNSLHNRYATQAASLLSLNRQLAGAMVSAVLAAIIVAQLGVVVAEPSSPAELATAQEAYNRIFLVGFFFVLAAFIPGLAMPGRRRMRVLQASRSAEYDEAAST